MTPAANTDTAALFRAAQAGDTDARNRIVTANLGLVYTVLHALRIDKHEEYLSDGVLGLCRAAETYDPARAQFSTYATWWIRSFVSRARTRDRRAIAVPWGEPRDATHRALARRARLRPRSIDAPFGGTELTLADMLAIDAPLPDEQVESAQRTREVDAMLAPLDRRSRDVLLRRARGETLASIGDSLGLSRERIRQIEAAAFRNLRAAADTNIQPRPDGREGDRP